MSYDWLAGAVFFISFTAINSVGSWLAFQVPSLRKMWEMNTAADELKLAREPYREAVRINMRAATWQALAFYALVMPFCVSLDPVPAWRFVGDAVAVLLIYDFTYYLTHRFLFHGKPLRRIHALHHRALEPTNIDALYVHPVETLIGQGLFQVAVPLVAVVSGGPLNVFSMVLATLVFVHAGTLNHAWVDLPKFPFRWLQFLTTAHAAHHVDMKHGNYSQITLLFDWLFGTYEKPVVRAAP